MKINLYFKSIALLGMLSFLSCSKDKQSGQTAIQNDGPITLKSGIIVEKKGTQYFWDGDLLAGKKLVFRQASS